MKKTAQTSSTQAFTEIVDIRDNIVILRGNNACMILQINSVNFSLLSATEQDAKVAAYAAMLNSLSYPIQIYVRSKPVDIMPYVESLSEIAQKTQNEKLRSYISRYKEFVTNLVKMSIVLDKQFYLIIPYSSLEGGVTSVVQNTKKDTVSNEAFFQQAQTSLQTKAEGLLSQIHRLSLQAKVMEKDALLRLFYDIYNNNEPFPLTHEDISQKVVKGAN